MIVETFAGGSRQHVGGKVETFKPCGRAADLLSEKAGTAADIYRQAERAMPGEQVIGDLFRYPIMQSFDQRSIETPGILLEEVLHVTTRSLGDRQSGG